MKIIYTSVLSFVILITFQSCTAIAHFGVKKKPTEQMVELQSYIGKTESDVRFGMGAPDVETLNGNIGKALIYRSISTQRVTSSADIIGPPDPVNFHYTQPYLEYNEQEIQFLIDHDGLVQNVITSGIRETNFIPRFIAIMAGITIDFFLAITTVALLI